MILVGVLFLATALSVIAIAVTGGTSPTEITFGSLRVESTTAGFFLGGIVTTSLLLIGVWFVSVGIDGWRRRQTERRNLRAAASGDSAGDGSTVDVPEQPRPRHDILPPIGAREERVKPDGR